MSQQKIEKTEYIISLILRWGVVLCALVIAGGWTLSFLHGHGLESLHKAMTGQETSVFSVPRNFDEFWFGISHSKSQVIIAFGLLLLILLPITRVVASIAIFLFEKDYLFVGISIFVSSILILSMVMGRAL